MKYLSAISFCIFYNLCFSQNPHRLEKWIDYNQQSQYPVGACFKNENKITLVARNYSPISPNKFEDEKILFYEISNSGQANLKKVYKDSSFVIYPLGGTITKIGKEDILIFGLKQYFNSSAKSDGYIARFDKDYNLKWKSYLDFTSFDYDSFEIIGDSESDSKGNIYAVGNIQLEVKKGEFSPDNTLVFKLDSVGKIIWQKKFKFSPFNETAKEVVVMDDNHIVINVSKEKEDFGDPNRIHDVICLDSLGNIVWKFVSNENINLEDTEFHYIFKSNSKLYSFSSFAEKVNFISTTVKIILTELNVQNGKIITSELLSKNKIARMTDEAPAICDNKNFFINMIYQNSLVIDENLPTYQGITKFNLEKGQLHYVEYEPKKYQTIYGKIGTPDNGMFIYGTDKRKILNSLGIDSMYVDIWYLRTDSLGCVYEECVPTTIPSISNEGKSGKDEIITSIPKSNIESVNFKLSPNPTFNNTILTWPDNYEIHIIYILNSIGDIIEEIKLSPGLHEKTLNTEYYPPGLYFISIEGDKGSFASVKFSKN